MKRAAKISNNSSELGYIPTNEILISYRKAKDYKPSD